MLCVPRAKAIGLFTTVPPLGSPRSSGSNVATSISAARLVARLSKRRSPPGCSTSAVFPCTAAPSSCAFRPSPSSTGSGPVPKEHEQQPAPTGAILLGNLGTGTWGTPSRKSVQTLDVASPRSGDGPATGLGGGRRDNATVQKRVDRRTQGDVNIYCTVHWAPYAALIPQGKRGQRQEMPHILGRNHCRSGIGSGVANGSPSLSRG